MTPVLVDAPLLLELACDRGERADEAAQVLAALGQGARLVISPPVLAELALAYRSHDAMLAALPQAVFQREALPEAAPFLAGRAYAGYLRRGGRGPVLSQLLIGAHAAICGYRLATRDGGLLRDCYPTLMLVCGAAPDGDFR